jgi:hypothetical protein
VLGVRQSLLDLEPLPDSLRDQQQQQQDQQQTPLSRGGSASPRGRGYLGSGCSSSSAPAASFDPLGAVAHPTSVAPATGELISLDAEPEGAAPAAAPPPQRSDPAAAAPQPQLQQGDVRSQLQDLLL